MDNVVQPTRLQSPRRDFPSRSAISMRPIGWTIGMDSLRAVEMIFDLEEKFDMRIS
jgi:hypothetical protein